MTEKRYRTEWIEGATLPFIVDNYSAKKHKTMTGYKAYDTNTVKKCDELTDLLNNYEKENRQLKQEIGNLEHTKDFCADVCADCERLEKENEQLKALIKKTLETTPIEHTLAVELKNSVRELYD